MAEAAIKFGAAETPLYREAPNNIEAEQALLGAVLVNNEAFYRVSDFLEPQHFFEPIHQQLYELAANLIRAVCPPQEAEKGGSKGGDYLFEAAAVHDEVGDAADVTAVDATHTDRDPGHRVVVFEMHAEGDLGDRLGALEAGPGRGVRPTFLGVQQ